MYRRGPQRDRTGILQYTLATWSESQFEIYDQILTEAFDRIQEFPEIGHPVEGSPSNMREYHLRHHVVVYRLESSRVVILRILNPKRRR